VNIAGVSAGSLRQSRVGELSHWKAATVAHAARRGVFAALLAGEGMTGPAPIFEGTMAFEKLVSQAPLGGVALRPGDFMITRTSIKAWPAEYHSQSAITAALRLRSSIENIDQIESVVVQSHDAAVDIIGSEPEKWRPQSRETADHSLPYIVAVALADGEITDRQFSSARFNDPKLIDLVQRVKIERNGELSRRYPEAVANNVIVHLRDRRVLREEVDYALGHARNPINDAQVEAKLYALADRRLGAERVSAVLQQVWDLDALPDVRTITQALVLP
jgi:2-methylcitrate dehydratase